MGILENEHPRLTLLIETKTTFGEAGRKKMTPSLKSQKKIFEECTCSLLNSNGGVLIAPIANEGYEYEKDALGDDLEKALNKLLDPEPVQNVVQIKQFGKELWFDVRPWPLAERRAKVYTLYSGLVMRSLTCVIPIPNDNVVDYFLKRSKQEHDSTGDPVYNKAHQFYEEGIAELNQSLDFGEGVHVELKQAETELSKYISAFANTLGGYYFIGITDKKEVVGCDWGREQLDTKYQNIIKKCNEAQDRAVHMHGCTGETPWSPEVKVIQITSAPGKYVIGIKVPRFCCAVFAKDPESWEIVENEVSQIKCHKWLEKMQSASP